MPDHSDPGIFPIRILEVELSEPLPSLPVEPAADGTSYRSARMLVRLHTYPLGIVDLAYGESGHTPSEVAEAIWGTLQSEIREHLQGDGLHLPDKLEPGGISLAQIPPCIQAREGFLATAPHTTVVVATHNRTESLGSTLQSLMEMEYPNFDIIVVDNAPSSDATEKYLANRFQGEPRVRYVCEEYAGLSVAHNRGLRDVTAPFVAFTDDDVQVDRYWLTELIRGFRVTNQVACVTGMILPAELETKPQVWIEQYGGFSKGFDQQIYDLGEHRVRDPLYPFTAGWFGSGASMAFNTAILRELGGFDPSTGAGTLAQGGDDLSAFFEVVTAGYCLVYQPASILRHWHRREYASLQHQAFGYGVGLTAFLTKTLVDEPGQIFSFASRLPAGLVYLLSPKSRKNANKQAGYPVELNRLERKGMLYGPIAYMRSRQRAKQAGLYPRKDRVIPQASLASQASQKKA